MRDNILVGKTGEQFAEDLLLKKEYKIIGKNVRTWFGEIDIIAQKLNCYYFIEVKTRIGDLKGKPYENITRSKKGHMLRSAQSYILENKLARFKHSLDVISIILDNNLQIVEIHHYQRI